VPLVDSTFDAVICRWVGTAVAHLSADAGPLRAVIAAACAAGMHVFVVSDDPLDDVDGQLRARPGGPGRLHLCVDGGAAVFEVTGRGPEQRWCRSGTGSGPASVRWASNWLARRGITGRLVLIVGSELGSVGRAPSRDSWMLVPELARAVAVSVGVEPAGVPRGIVHLGGGPARLLELLEDQLLRRRQCRVPWIDDDPAFVLQLPDEPELERAAEAMGTLANGWAGTRGSREEDGAGTAPLFVVSGIYTGGEQPQLLAGPVWTNLSIPSPGRDLRILDLRTGVLVRQGGDGSELRTMRFASMARPRVMALRAEGAVGEVAPAQLTPGDNNSAAGGVVFDRFGAGDVAGARAGHVSGGGIALAVHDRQVADGNRTSVERLAAWAANGAGPAHTQNAAAELTVADHIGFDALLAEHRRAWADRWAEAGVDIGGHAGDELAARFAVFHLLGAAHDGDEAAVGARGLSGGAYGGHVFWDADVYVLPALAALRPDAARAMLEYRVRRLPAARAAAEASGEAGARFPWESAHDGTDVTPRFVIVPRGESIPIRTGLQEEHIVADVAWAAWEYAAWTADEEFLRGPGRDLLLETARHWAGRVRMDRHGRGHLYGLMGPDEYHEVVDDDAYTNIMARWHLRRAAELAGATDGDAAEATGWRRTAEVLVDGWDPARRLHEQFAGYWRLEPLQIADLAQPPVAADILLGSERVAGSQIIKQPDVLMAHHLVPDEMVAGSVAGDLAFYGPRTAHGSSLSPAIHAALLARAGMADEALAMFRVAARLDLDDITGTTAGGLHLATMGGVWQALCYGFAGARPRGAVLAVGPCLPAAWDELALRFHFRGQPVEVIAAHDAVTVRCQKPLTVSVQGRPAQRCPPPGTTFAVEGSGR